MSNWLVKKLTPNLVQIASASIAGTSSVQAVASAVVFDGAGNAYVAGYASAAVTNTQDFLVVKYSPSLVVLASATVGFPAVVDQAMSIALAPSGDLYVSGDSGGDSLTARFSSSLVLISTVVFDGGFTDRGRGGTSVDAAGNVYVAGSGTSAAPTWG
ncbi:MAG: hypothetical protein M0D55_09905 [Elusimicrobiota bacterium]|nr:MAG: hypothetical protein M0D55_09905 [Elusimicrobiota bacterium]